MKCNEECDILIKFTNRDDPYYYCIKDEIFNAISVSYTHLTLPTT